MRVIGGRLPANKQLVSADRKQADRKTKNERGRARLLFTTIRLVCGQIMFAVSRAVDGLLAVAGLQRQSRRVTVPQSSLFWHDRCRQYFLRRKAQVVASACLTAQTGHMRNIRGFYSFEEMGDSCRYSQELSATQVLQRKVVKASTKIVTLQDRLAESQLQKSDAERRIAEAER